MNKDIHKIRKSIKARNKIRHLQQDVHEPFPPYTISDEEKYSTYPEVFYNENTGKKSDVEPLFRSSYFYKLLISVGLFLFSFITFKTNIIPFEKPKQLLYYALNEEFPFATVHDWYVNYLGIPLSLVPQDKVISPVTNGQFNTPITGEVVESFSTNGAGIMISPENKSYVHAMNKGIVIFAGSTSDTDKTIVIQHPNRTETTYGMLSTIDVHLYQLVEANEVIGTKTPTDESETVFFSIEKENSYIDPAKVIRVDGIP